MAPVCNINNPLTNEEYKLNKLKTRFIAILIAVVIIVGTRINLNEYIIYSFIALTLVNLLLIISVVLNNQKGAINEKDSI